MTLKPDLEWMLRFVLENGLFSVSDCAQKLAVEPARVSENLWRFNSQERRGTSQDHSHCSSVGESSQMLWDMFTEQLRRTVQRSRKKALGHHLKRPSWVAEVCAPHKTLPSSSVICQYLYSGLSLYLEWEFRLTLVKFLWHIFN